MHVCSPDCALPSGECVEAWIDAHPDGGTLAEVGAEFGLTSERVRQIERDALTRIAVAMAVEEGLAIEALEEMARDAA